MRTLQIVSGQKLVVHPLMVEERVLVRADVKPVGST
jgi:hypothetical protein